MSDKQVSHYCKGFLGIAAVLIAVFIGLGVGAVVTWLTFVYVCSYVKLAITLIKYVPQVYVLLQLPYILLQIPYVVLLQLPYVLLQYTFDSTNRHT